MTLRKRRSRLRGLGKIRHSRIELAVAQFLNASAKRFLKLRVLCARGNSRKAGREQRAAKRPTKNSAASRCL